MKFHPDVFEDLLTLYNAGEASAATRALVEEQLAADPDLARRVAAGAADPPLPAVAPAPSTAEKQSVERTRRLLRVRSQTLAMAILFTALPLSCVVRDGDVTFLVVRDAPVVAAAWGLAAAVLGGVYAVVRHRMRPPRG